MRLAVVLATLLIATSADAQPRDSVEVGLFGGAAAIEEESGWGEMRYALGGADARYVRRREAAHFGVTAASMVGARYALNEPSFEEFGWVADQFSATYVGGGVGFDSRTFGFELTTGFLVETVDSDARTAALGVGFSTTFRAFDPRFVALFVKVGSTDGWLADRTGGSIGMMHDHRGFRFVAAVVDGATRVPPLLSNNADGPPARPRPHGRSEFLTAFDFLGHVELGAHVESVDFGVELTFGAQLPVGRVYYRQHFGTMPAVSPRRAARLPPERRRPFAWIPPR